MYKPILQTKKNQGYFLAFLAFAFMFIFASCNKSKNEDLVQPDISSINFIHSLPGYTSLDFYIGNQRSTSSALLFAQSTGNISLYSGNAVVSVFIGGSNVGLTSGTIGFAPDKNYSLFVTHKSATNDSITAIVLEDNLASPTTGKAKLRFVNLFRDAQVLDLGVENGANLFTNKAYNTSTDFIEVDPASYVFQIKDTGTTNVRASSAAIPLEAGKIYTVWSKGKVGGTADSAIGVQITKNL